VIPAKIEGDSRPIGAPSNWNEAESGRCGALFVRHDVVGGLQFMTSAWEPDTNEIGWLLAGAKIQLGVSARQHPVVNLGVGDPPEDGLPVFTVRQSIDAEGKRSVRATIFIPPTDSKGGAVAWADATVEGGSIGEAVGQAVDYAENLAREQGLI